MSEQKLGTVVEIIGAVVDVEFPRGQVPKIYDAMRIDAHDLTLKSNNN